MQNDLLEIVDIFSYLDVILKDNGTFFLIPNRNLYIVDQAKSHWHCFIFTKLYEMNQYLLIYNLNLLILL